MSDDLRQSLPGIAQDECLGDNLAILLASYFEPGIESDELDDSGTWKQGAIDASNRVLDAIHAHYSARIEALEAENAKLRATTDRIARVDDSLAKQLRTSIENNAVLNTRAEAAERALAEAVEVMRPLCKAVLPFTLNGACTMVSARTVLAARAFVQQHEGKK